MQTVVLRDAKSNLSELIRTLEDGKHAEIMITRNGQAIAKLVPVNTANVSMHIGVARGKFTVPDDIDIDNGAIATLFG